MNGGQTPGGVQRPPRGSYYGTGATEGAGAAMAQGPGPVSPAQATAAARVAAPPQPGAPTGTSAFPADVVGVFAASPGVGVGDEVRRHTIIADSCQVFLDLMKT